MIMSCHSNTDLRVAMYDEIRSSPERNEIWENIQENQVLETILGGNPLTQPCDVMVPIWCTTMKWFNKVYRRVLRRERRYWVACMLSNMTHTTPYNSDICILKAIGTKKKERRQKKTKHLNRPS